MKIIKLNFLIPILLFININIYAVAPPPGGPPIKGGGRPCWPPPCVPINKGISLLMVVGVLFVYHKNKRDLNVKK